MDLILPIIGVIAGGVAPMLIARFLPRKTVKALGVKLGKAITAFGSVKMGTKNWNKAEDSLQITMQDFVDGVDERLNSDDK